MKYETMSFPEESSASRTISSAFRFDLKFQEFAQARTTPVIPMTRD